ncbi:MAG: pyrroline-5-carboxylate reductase [Desertimonas sp.]
MTSELVIVGGGNMGAALLGGLIAAGRAPGELAVAEPLAPRRDELAAAFPGVTIGADVAAARGAVIAVKPPDVAAATAAAVAAGAGRVLSIAAGVAIATIEASAGVGVAVVRAMPNTPALIGQGASAIAAGSSADEAALGWATEILGAVGTVDRVAEHQLDAVTALTGSGPAYVFLLAEALIDAAVGAGLARPLATRLTTQLLVGSSALLADRGDAAALRAMVTSPGGTTAAAIAQLERHALRAAVADAVDAAARRSAELRVD